MNNALFDIDGKDEFVITPAPNCYLVSLRLDEHQAEAFGGNQRITLALALENDVETEGKADFALLYVRGLNDDNSPSDYMLKGEVDGCDFTPEMEAVLTAPSFTKRVQESVENFFQATKEDLAEYYTVTSVMRAIGGLNVNFDD